MKLWYSFLKELQLSSKSWYFYIEVGMAFVLLLILLIAVPEKSDPRIDEYLYAGDLPQDYVEVIYRSILDEEDEAITPQQVEVQVGDGVYEADLFVTDTRNLYFIQDREALRILAEEDREIAVEILLGSEGDMIYRYYLQGYESQRLKNLYMILHNNLVSPSFIQRHMETQTVKTLEESPVTLNNRENVLPVFLTYNGSLMGLFIIAAYIFLDKQEGIILAYAVTASKVWHYLLSKIGVLMVTMLGTSLILVVPMMGFGVNYLNLFLLVTVSAFAFSSLGLVLTSYYRDMMQSFGVFYILIVFLMIPNISYFTPSWEPQWIHFLPTYHLLEGFKEIILGGDDIRYLLSVSGGYLLCGLVLFWFANHRFKKTLTMG